MATKIGVRGDIKVNVDCRVNFKREEGKEGRELA
jgi:hypothetical protein